MQEEDKAGAVGRFERGFERGEGKCRMRRGGK